METKEVNAKYYEDYLVKTRPSYADVSRALEIVKKYIIRENLIIVGGMAIDLALKMKGDKLYDDNVLPDYDFLSTRNHYDAYEIAQWLSRTGFENISVINATHPTTLRVRVNFVVVADVTFVPKNILEHIPTLKYRGFNIVHPHYQMIDLARSISYPLENAYLLRETVLHRAKKDMKRYDILYGHYPLRILNVKEEKIILGVVQQISAKILHKQCLSGFAALNYWIGVAQKHGYAGASEFGFIQMGDTIKYQIPVDSHGITIYSDEIAELFKELGKNGGELRFYEKFLDKLPRKIIIDNKYELLENEQMMAAHHIGNRIYIANLQNVMLYLLLNYIVLQKMRGEKRGFSFYAGYLKCRDLIEWAAKKYYATTAASVKSDLERFFPTSETYGANNYSESYMLGRLKFEIKNGKLPKSALDEYAQPSNVYGRDLIYKKVPKKYYEFDISKSKLFQADGRQIDNWFE